MDAEFALASGKPDAGKLVGGKLAGGKLLAVGGAAIGSVPGEGMPVAFVEMPRFADGVFVSADVGPAADAKSGRDVDGPPLFSVGLDEDAGNEGKVGAEDGKAEGMGVSSDGKAADGNAAAVPLLSGSGNVPLVTGKGDPRVAVGRVRELSLLSDSRSF